MSVRHSMLAILDQGPCYGYQLRSEFHRRTGTTWPLNVGQIYNTLERLERDGLVERGEADEQGHVFWHITTEGSAEVAKWLSSPVVQELAPRDELTIKLALAATLPNLDVTALLAAQREATARRLDALQATTDEAAAGGEHLVQSLITDAFVFHAEAELRWIDHLIQHVTQEPRPSFALELSAERPKRGRPVKQPAQPAPSRTA